MPLMDIFPLGSRSGGSKALFLQAHKETAYTSTAKPSAADCHTESLAIYRSASLAKVVAG
jgi:hypothetical protein